jgi:hypothetical protein
LEIFVLTDAGLKQLLSPYNVNAADVQSWMKNSTGMKIVVLQLGDDIETIYLPCLFAQLLDAN